MDDHKIENFYIGTSGLKPAALLVNQNEVVKQVGYSQGYSVSSVALSPDKNMLGVGLRNKLMGDRNGMIEVYPLNNEGNLPEKKMPIFRVYQPTSVSSLVIHSDKYAFSGGLDGKILIWDINNSQKALHILNAHIGPVLALASIADDFFGSIGSEGKFRIWDISTGTLHYSFAGSNESSQLNNLLKIFTIPDLALIVTHHPCGSVFLHDFNEGFTNKPLNFGDGKAAAITIIGKELVFVDFSSLILRVYYLEEERELKNVSLKKPVRSINTIDLNNLNIIYKDGSAEIWKYKPELSKLSGIRAESVRSASSMPVKFQMDEYKEKFEIDRKGLIQEAKEIINKDDFNEVKAGLDNLIQNGLEIEAQVMLAEWCSKQNKPLWELQVRRNLCETLPEHPFSAVHFYTFGVLLENLREYQLAINAYNAALKSDPEYKDSAQRTDKLKEFLDSMDESKNRIVDYMDIDKAEGEIEKCAILNKPLENRMTLKKEADDSTYSKKIYLDLPQLTNHLDNENWEICKECEVEVNPNKYDSRNLLFYTGPDKPNEMLTYAFEIIKIAGETNYIHRILLQPTAKNLTIDNDILELKGILNNIDNDDINLWFNSLKNKVNSAVNTYKTKQGSIKKTGW